jgi:hypothetical protein
VGSNAKRPTKQPNHVLITASKHTHPVAREVVLIRALRKWAGLGQCRSNPVHNYTLLLVSPGVARGE